MKSINPYIFSKNIKNNNNHKTLLPINLSKNDVGEVKYFPSTSEEWKNNIYCFNNNHLKYLPSFDISIDKLIKNYFNSYFFKSNPKFLDKKFKFSKGNAGFKQIYISTSELNHVNYKTLITLYVYNKQKITLLRKINTLNLFTKSSLKKIFLMNILYNKYSINSPLNLIKFKEKTILYKLFLLLERYKLKLGFNQSKFEDNYLYVLSNIISKFYKKKVEFNIVNLNSLVYSSDIFTKILSLKLKNRNINTLKTMKFILNKAILPKVNGIKEKSSLVKSVDYNLLENKYKNMNLNSMIKNNLDELLNEFYDFYSNFCKVKLYKIIFNSIHYKNIGGIRLEAKGRLTRRYRADKSQLKIRLKGGLKNIDSSYKRLSSVLRRNYDEYNLDYSMFAAKRRIGAFAVKGWISGK